MTERVVFQPRFGQLVKRRRENLGLSQGDLGERLGGVSRQRISSLELGRSGPGLQALVTLSRALEVLPSVMLSDSTGEEWGAWWRPLVEGLESDVGKKSPEYLLGYDDALLDVCEELNRHVLTWRPNKQGYSDVLPDDEGGE